MTENRDGVARVIVERVIEPISSWPLIRVLIERDGSSKVEVGLTYEEAQQLNEKIVACLHES